jgi:serine/threonine protein kinase
MPDELPPGDGGLEATTRRCAACGGIYTGETHIDCPSAGGALKKGGSASSASHLDELPSEARPFDTDPARQVSQYILVQQIGRGGMGTVWKAWDRKLTRWVAVKFLLATEDEDIARFQREAKLAARLRHPNIAPLYEVGEAPPMHPGQPPRSYLVMEFIDGQSLAAVQLPLRDAVEIFVKVARGMEAAHKAGVVHRDLKPANIMLTSDRWPYVMDFGLAKSLQTESSLSVSGAVMGTPAYMAPEQAQGRLTAVDARSDVYSLGATIYAVLCKKPPFTGESAMDIVMKVVQETPTPPRQVNPEIPEPVERIILKAMAKVKEERYASAGEMADDLQRFLDNAAVAARPPAAPRKGGRKRVLATAAVLIAGGLSALLFWPSPQPAPPPPDRGPKAPETGAATKPPDPVPPAPVIPAPPTGPTAAEEASKRQRAWREAWAALQPPLAFAAWKPGDAGLPAKARNALTRMADEAAAGDAIQANDWVREQVRTAGDAVKDATGTRAERRARLERAAAWCEALAAAVQGVGSLRAAADEAGRIRADAKALAAQRGTFTLRVFVEPYAEVRRLRCGGKDVALAQTATPLVVENLEIGAVELVLAHPQLKEKTVTIGEDELQEGKGFLVRGRMQDPALSKGVEP